MSRISNKRDSHLVGLHGGRGRAISSDSVTVQPCPLNRPAVAILSVPILIRIRRPRLSSLTLSLVPCPPQHLTMFVLSTCHHSHEYNMNIGLAYPYKLISLNSKFLWIPVCYFNNVYPVYYDTVDLVILGLLASKRRSEIQA